MFQASGFFAWNPDFWPRKPPPSAPSPGAANRVPTLRQAVHPFDPGAINHPTRNPDMTTTQTTQPAGVASDFGPVQACDLLRRLRYADTLMRMVGASSAFITSYPDDANHPVETRTHGRDPSRFHEVVRAARCELDEVCLLVSNSHGGPAIGPYAVLRVVEALELSTSLDLEQPAVTHADVRNVSEIACTMLAELYTECIRLGVHRLANGGAQGEVVRPTAAH